MQKKNIYTKLNRISKNLNNNSGENKYKEICRFERCLNNTRFIFFFIDGKMISANKKTNTTPQLSEKEVRLVVQNWLRIVDVKMGWIHDFDKIVTKYAKNFKLLKVLQGHDDVMTCVRFSSDGSRIISSSYDETVRIWNIASGKQIQIFKGHSDLVYAAEFSPDGNIVVSCSKDKTIRLWDVKSGSEIMKLQGHSDQLLDVNFSPDGKKIVSCSYDKTIRLWDVSSGKELQKLKGHLNGILGVQFSPDGQMIASSSIDNTIGLWDVKLGVKLKQLKGHSNVVMCAKFSPDGQCVVSCSWDETIRIWDVKSGKELKRLQGHSNVVRIVKYFQEGQTIVSCSNDNTIRLWNVRSGYEVQKWRELSGCVLGIDSKYGDDIRKASCYKQRRDGKKIIRIVILLYLYFLTIPFDKTLAQADNKKFRHVFLERGVSVKDTNKKLHWMMKNASIVISFLVFVGKVECL
ncbi:G-protein beta WD-40 repeats containing protein [Reticulomyxa filosa]|uniref:G-protein beta WD-40 repeats containing protein n=1 Tax=Reticulomyxa filosa TaxID=46433 RepID=X6NMQ4_RETFI|nr:G-protein beta WD-40 repeats containing protein [Reticulomyxa filosa]|eukprot:ETO27540.1 G-protein beta WD-40 repeats containing protein [Reticulomyxa filosa]